MHSRPEKRKVSTTDLIMFQFHYSDVYSLKTNFQYLGSGFQTPEFVGFNHRISVVLSRLMILAFS